MSDMNAQVTITLRDRLTAVAQKMTAAMKSLQGQVQKLGQARNTGDWRANQLRREEVVARKLRMEYGRLRTAMGKLRSNASGLAMRGLAVAGTAVIGTFAAMKTIMGPAIEMERFRTQLEQLEGSSQKGQQAMKWITDFATRTPLELPQVVEAYASLKNVGLDPTNGSLLALVDTMAASGKGFENLGSLTLAMGQAWTKQKLQGDDARQLLEAGVPVWDLLAKKMGKSSAEIMKLAEKGKLGRKEILMLLDAMEERAAGAADKFSKSWDGISSNISDMWYQFRVAIADSGPFQELKKNLQGVLEQINKWQADGTLTRLANQIGGELTTAIRKASQAAQGMWKAGLVAAWIIDKMAAAAGGYENLGYMAVGLFAMGKAMGTIVAAAQVVGILAKIAAVGTGGTVGLLGLAVALAAVAAAAYHYRDAIGAMAGVSGDLAFSAMYPLLALVTVLPRKFLELGMTVGRSLRQAFDSIDWSGLRTAAEKALIAFAAGFHRKASEIVASVASFGSQLTASITSGLGSLFAIGAQWITSLWDGMKSVASQISGWAAGIGAQIRGAFSMGGAPAAPAGAPRGGGRYGMTTTAPASTPDSGIKKSRRFGGSLYGGDTALVGEGGPEIVTAKRHAAVTPISKLSGGPKVTNINLGGLTVHGTSPSTARAFASVLMAQLRAGLHDGAYA